MAASAGAPIRLFALVDSNQLTDDQLAVKVDPFFQIVAVLKLTICVQLIDRVVEAVRLREWNGMSKGRVTSWRDDDGAPGLYLYAKINHPVDWLPGSGHSESELIN